MRSSERPPHARPARRNRKSLGRSILLLLLGSMTVLAMEACDRPAEDRTNPSHVSIALVGPGLDDSSWPVLMASAEWFSRIEKDIEVEALAPERASALAQRAMLEQLQEDRRHDVICVMPYDPAAIAAVLRNTVRKGKSVITIGRDVPNSSRYGYCGPSEFEIGRSAARACSQMLEGRPKTILLLHAGRDRGAWSRRLTGFEEEIRSYPDLHVLKALDCGGNSLDALHLVRKETRKYPRTGCWVFLDDWAFDALPAGERMLPLGNGIVLCHTSSEYFRLVDNGRILALITYNLRETVDAALFLAEQAAEDVKASAARNVDAPCEIITARNMADHRAQWIDWVRPDYHEVP